MFKKKLLVGALSAMVCCSFAYEAEAADSMEGSQIGTSQSVDYLVFVNKTHKLPDDYEANFAQIHPLLAEYGFILRYPQGKESITGYSYEPWHFRYVGKETAKKISDAGLVMEEYLK